MDLKADGNYIVIWDEQIGIKTEGIYYAELILKTESNKKNEKGEIIYKHEKICKECFHRPNKYKLLKKILNENQLISGHINRNTSQKNRLHVQVNIIKFLSNRQLPTEEWQNKKTLKENIKTISISLPPTTNFVTMSLHRSMNFEDL